MTKIESRAEPRHNITADKGLLPKLPSATSFIRNTLGEMDKNEVK